MNSSTSRLQNRKAPVFLLFVNRMLLLALLLDLLFMGYCILTGFPPRLAGHALKLKNLRTPFVLSMVFFSGWLALRPEGGRKSLLDFKRAAEGFAAKPYSVWVVFGVAALLFTWQQVSEYLAVEINFLPFSFFDYMLYYYFHGHIHFTGLLHNYYHVNNILFLFAPFWKIFQSPWLLVLSHGVIGALSVFPLYIFAKEKFRESLPALFTAILYLNYRYLQNVLQMNFCPEIFYPLFIFWTVASAIKGQWFFYYLALGLGLLVKEDSFLYFSAVGVWVLFLSPKTGKRTAIFHGALTVLMAVAYSIFTTRVFMPWTGNTLLKGDLSNFGSRSESEPEILAYAGPVIPFVFIAFVSGVSRLMVKLPSKRREWVLWGVMLLLLGLNGGNYRTEKVTAETLASIRWAKKVPPDTNLVTHGHLLPYVGYRKQNYFFAGPFELPSHRAHLKYVSADYYLIDRTVNPYPMDSAYFDAKIQSLKDSPGYELVLQDSKRFLFRRKK